jgi:8-oxo-dGTP diphosphatase
VIQVVAGLIQRNGRLLICQRRRNDSFPLKWEFPGGKLKRGESPAQAVVRELEEELGVRAVAGREVYRTRHRYAEHCEEIELVFVSAQLETPEVRNLAFEQIVWEEPAALPHYDFLPADAELIRLLSTGAVVVPGLR